MTNMKITKGERFESLLTIPAVQADQGLVDFINHELELLAKKNTSEKKPTAVQVANEGLKQTIMDVLTENGGLMTVTDVQKSCDALAELSNQRISALLRQMRDDGKVERVEEKRKAYFKAV